MRRLLVILLVGAVLVVVLALAVGATLAVVGVGWIVVQVFPEIMLFQASIIVLAVTTALLLVVYRMLNLSQLELPAPDEDEEEEDDDDLGPITFITSVPADRPPPETHPARPSRPRKRRR